VTEPYAQVGHGCGWRGARRGLAAHAAGCWCERGRRHLEQAQATRLLVEALVEDSAAAAAAAKAELAKVHADAAFAAAAAAAQLEAAAGVLAGVKAELTVEVAAVKRESAAQLQRLQQAEVAQGWVALSPCASDAQPLHTRFAKIFRCLYV
jgi:hypothetical protein